MKYNFDERIDRTGTGAFKLEGYKSYIFHADNSMVLPFKDEEFIHMWVADMEFATAPEILEAIDERLDRKILGYTGNLDSRLYDALNKWCMERYDWTFKQANMFTEAGIVTAIVKIISYLVEEDEYVLFNTPSYGQFANVCRLNHRSYITSDMKVDEEGRYSIDFDDLDEKMAKSKLFIFCNPHNPTGRAWTEEEITKLAELIKKHDIWVISDEIHCDLRRADAPKHVPLGKIMEDYDKLVTCMSASKSFNIAGLAESCIIIRSDELKDKWMFYSNGLVNPISHEALIAAYERGSDWLAACNEYLDGNFELLNTFLAENLPEAIVTPSETTYLGWVNFENYFEEDEDVELFFAEVAGVLIEADKAFVENANRRVRLNLACPRDYLKEGLERMADALLNKHDEKFQGGVSKAAL